MHARNPFRISRAQRSAVRNVFLEIESEGMIAYGEASPNPYYGETVELVRAKLHAIAGRLENWRVECASDITDLWAAGWETLAPSRAAQCALDVALWDLLGKKRGVSVTRLILDHDPEAVTSFATIGLSNPAELESKLAELVAFPKIKIKSGPEPDDGTVESVLARTKALISVDANCAWESGSVERRVAALAGPRVLFVEQPLPPEADVRMREILPRCLLPVMADESCVTLDDVEKMQGHFSGFNIKLVKCGGITPAISMLRRGRELGLSVMIGCMLESSLLVSAGAVIAQHCDHVDLDGAWLLSDDPFAGMAFENGVLRPSKKPGLGVWPLEMTSGI
jgi:L-alanine-DL-glutamate epimerase-like enolase superfamily enzyme